MKIFSQLWTKAGISGAREKVPDSFLLPLEHLADRLSNSLKRRMAEMVDLGNKAGHGDRWAKETQVLQKIEKILSERGR